MRQLVWEILANGIAVVQPVLIGLGLLLVGFLRVRFRLFRPVGLRHGVRQQMGIESRLLLQPAIAP